MKAYNVAGVSMALLGTCFAAIPASAQYTEPPTRGPAENGSPAWFLQGSFPDPGGRVSVDAQGNVTVLTEGPRGSGGAAEGAERFGIVLLIQPPCRGSVVCGGNRTASAEPRPPRMRVQWAQTMGYTFDYPYQLPAGTGGARSQTIAGERS